MLSPAPDIATGPSLSPRPSQKQDTVSGMPALPVGGPGRRWFLKRDAIYLSPYSWLIGGPEHQRFLKHDDDHQSQLPICTGGSVTVELVTAHVVILYWASGYLESRRTLQYVYCCIACRRIESNKWKIGPLQQLCLLPPTR